MGGSNGQISRQLHQSCLDLGRRFCPSILPWALLWWQRATRQTNIVSYEFFGVIRLMWTGGLLLWSEVKKTYMRYLLVTQYKCAAMNVSRFPTRIWAAHKKIWFPSSVLLSSVLTLALSYSFCCPNNCRTGSDRCNDTKDHGGFTRGEQGERRISDQGSDQGYKVV